MQRFRGRLVFKAHRLLYHSTLGLRVSKKQKKKKDEASHLDLNAWSRARPQDRIGIRGGIDGINRNDGIRFNDTENNFKVFEDFNLEAKARIGP